MDEAISTMAIKSLYHEVQYQVPDLPMVELLPNLQSSASIIRKVLAVLDYFCRLQV